MAPIKTVHVCTHVLLLIFVSICGSLTASEPLKLILCDFVWRS